MSKLKEILKENRLIYTAWCATSRGFYTGDLLHPHLGGYRAGGDRNSLVRPLFQTLHDRFDCRSGLDVGCAEGITVQDMIACGIDGWGMEGSAKALRTSSCPDRITVHDLTAGPYLAGRRFDVVWCCEVVEHVEPRFVGNVALTLAGNCGRYLAMTHALPGQKGFHHVNCRPPGYWIEMLEAAGLTFRRELTEELRGVVAAHNRSAFFAHSGLVFAR
jgi:hypothetical protein